MLSGTHKLRKPLFARNRRSFSLRMPRGPEKNTGHAKFNTFFQKPAAAQSFILGNGKIALPFFLLHILLFQTFKLDPAPGNRMDHLVAHELV